METVYNMKKLLKKKTRIGVLRNMKNYIAITDEVAQNFMLLILNFEGIDENYFEDLKKLYNKHRYSPRFILTNFKTEEEIDKYIRILTYSKNKADYFLTYKDIKKDCADIYEEKEIDENGKWVDFDNYYKEVKDKCNIKYSIKIED
jgi:hypothetical protein